MSMCCASRSMYDSAQPCVSAHEAGPRGSGGLQLRCRLAPVTGLLTPASPCSAKLSSSVCWPGGPDMQLITALPTMEG
eukprot:5723192-Lingulodinium_polyedra.AAC.1